ncbi:MAG: ribose 5-phosphate isomerase B [Candidatus Gastranaerophilales bacterium]|nr:ribose 5-phosphate isomerase B [Candidatus Gastranaerophilales bacterium]
MSDIKIAIGADHGGYQLKNKIIDYLKENGYEVKDFGTNSPESVDYPVIAKEVSKSIVNGNFDRGILVCGTGLGMAIVADKIKGIRAIACSDTCSAKYSRLHNDANVLCFGERIIGSELAKDIVKIWLETDFEAGRHQRRVDMMETEA